MARFKLFVSVVVLIGVCTLAATSFAKPAAKPKCGFNGDYSFFFWEPFFPVDGVGYSTVQLDPATNCRSGVVLPGGIINCYIDGEVFEDFIEGGSVFLETDGEGTEIIETNSSDGICDTGTNAIELDISVVKGGKSVLFSSNGVQYAGSGLIPQAGYFGQITGRGDKCFAGDISGCYDIRFWSPGDALPLTGDCTICLGGGFVTGGTCRCNVGFPPDFRGFETLSEIETGGYTLGEGCQSSTGLLSFVVSSDDVCDIASVVTLDFAVAQQGEELIGACYPSTEFDCSFEGWKQ